MIIEDRAFQNIWVKTTLRLLCAGAAGVVQYAPTGSGKTEMDVRVAKTKIDESGSRLAVFVHRDLLADQWMKRFALYGIRAQLIDASSDNDPDPRIGVYVVMLPTIDARLDRPQIKPWLASIDIAIWDEAHHCPAPMWQRVMALTGGQFLGPTATPWRMDGKGLGDCGFNATVSAPSPRELIRLGFLAPFRAYAPPMPDLDLSGLKSLGGDFNQGDVQKLLDTEQRLRQLVRWYTKFAGGRPAFGFAAGIVHAQHIAEAFRRQGWNAEYVEGDTDGVGEILDRLAVNDLQMVASCQKIYEGVDVPAVAAVMDDALTASTQRYIQRVGRMFRLHGDKADGVLVDTCGNIARHGMPDAERPWTLHGGVKGLERMVDPTRRCIRCWRVHAWAPCCPGCGAVYPPVRGEPATVWHLPGAAGMRPEVIASRQLGGVARLAKSRADLEAIAAVHRVTDPSWVDRAVRFTGLKEAAE